ncbi:MAG: MFS transporter [Anaerolineales bacterium]|nr:MFS transporter [Anaerolineales bacterium]
MFIKTQQQKLSDLYHEYPRHFWTLMGITFVDRLGGSLLYPFFALYLTKRFSVGMTEVGVLFMVWSASSFVGSMLGGALADRFGRKYIVIFSLVSTSLSAVIMGLVGSLQAFFTLALVVGIFTDIGGPAYEAMVADMLPEEKRAQGYGLIRVTFNLAVVIGPAIGGFLAARSYLLLFLADAAISLLSAALVAIYIPETKPEAQEGAKPESMGRTFVGYLRVLRDRVFMLFLLNCMLMVFVYMNMNTTLGVYLRDSHGVPESGYGLILSLNAIMVVLLQFPITRRIAGRPPLLVMALGMALYAIGFAMYGLVSIYALFMLAMVIITIGEMLIAPVSQALTAQLAPEDMRGRYMAIFGFSWGIPFAVGPYLAGLVMDNLDPAWLWYIVGMIGALATLGFLGLHRLVGARAAAAEAAAGD